MSVLSRSFRSCRAPGWELGSPVFSGLLIWASGWTGQGRRGKKRVEEGGWGGGTRLFPWNGVEAMVQKEGPCTRAIARPFRAICRHLGYGICPRKPCLGGGLSLTRPPPNQTKVSRQNVYSPLYSAPSWTRRLSRDELASRRVGETGHCRWPTSEGKGAEPPETAPRPSLSPSS